MPAAWMVGCGPEGWALGGGILVGCQGVTGRQHRDCKWM
jgi:hypothetical protein